MQSCENVSTHPDQCYMSLEAACDLHAACCDVINLSTAISVYSVDTLADVSKAVRVMLWSRYDIAGISEGRDDGDGLADS